MNPSPFWYNWMQLAAIGVCVFGASMALFPPPTQLLFNWMIFGDDATPFTSAADDYIEFVYGITGAVMLGWGLMMLIIVRGPFKNGDPFAWQLIAVPVLAWYVLDTAFSLASGYPENAVLNTVFLLALMTPLVATYRQFYPAAA